MAREPVSKRLANLSPAKRALLEHKLKERNSGGAEFKTIPRRLTPSGAPLSFAQQRLWFLNQLEPANPVYNEPTAVRLVGCLDLNALERSLNEILARHEILRTTIVSRNGSPIQQVGNEPIIELPVVDLRPCADKARASETQRRITEAIRRPFDLSRDLMMRVLLLALADQEHILLIVIHHIAFDGWSSAIFWRELSALYQAFTRDSPSPLPELTIQYADFALWQREWLQGDVLESHLAYWKKQLDGAAVELNLPTDHPRPAVQSYRGARQFIELSDELMRGLKALSRNEGVTLFMTLLAAFQTLLHRYTGQTDIALGSPIANRSRLEIEPMIGFFVNTLVLRSDLTGNPPFRELLSSVREMTLGAYAHQDLPFEKLVEELNPERSLSRAPLFQVMFVLQNTPTKAVQLEGLNVSPLGIHSGTVKFDLTLSMDQSVHGLKASLQYNTDLFTDATITRMLGHFETLLQGISMNADRPISDLPILTGAEKRQLLVEWNSTERKYSNTQCVHQLFEEQVERSPDAPAVVFEDRQLTYRELNQRADQLAHYLRQLGVGPEILVGLFMEPSPEMIIGVLGILKSGGAYVPLDPSYPKERLAFMLQDTRAPVLLTQQRLLDRLPEHSAIGICLDRDPDEVAQQGTENHSSAATATNLAYIIYTSGSTGRPKGVAVENRQLLNYSLDIMSRLEPVPGSSFAMVQPLTVDSSVTMIFPCLLSGGTLHLISREKAVSSLELAEYFHRWPMDFLKIAPSHLAALEASCGIEKFMPRRCLVIGGEESRWDWLRSLSALAPGCTVYNHYGPTETTVGVLMYRVRDGDVVQSYLKTPLGRPIANTQVYVLDNRLQPVPIGIPGELYIGGDNLARGYLNRPELAAACFVPNPFSVQPGARLYRTGDLARYLPDGNIEFLGRIDDQIKIRGFRVEPGEVEALLIQHPAIEQAVVMPSGKTPGEQQLVAYVVSKDTGAPNMGELRAFLKQKLPEYMVPSAFTFLDALPRTAHGKLDRKALLQVAPTIPVPSDGFVAPHTPVEELLAKIWSEVLKQDPVGIHNNFFDLGGHSLLAMQIVAKITDALKVTVPLREIFDAPTVAQLAERIETLRLSNHTTDSFPEPAGNEYESGQL